jgi:hypothetical protein
MKSMESSFMQKVVGTFILSILAAGFVQAFRTFVLQAYEDVNGKAAMEELRTPSHLRKKQTESAPSAGKSQPRTPNKKDGNIIVAR